MKKKSIFANRKAVVILIAVLFASSTIGAVFLQAPDPNAGLKLPEEQIVIGGLTEEQEAVLLGNFRVLIYAKRTSDSLIFNDLEILMSSFPALAFEDGTSHFVYLIEDESVSENIRIKTIGNETEFDSYDESAIISFICDNSNPYIASRYMICAINDM